MKKQYITSSANQTKRLGEKIAKQITKKGQAIIALQGELGSGKTTFIQGFTKGLGIKDKILSPTFVIYKKFGNFYHFDCYRIEKHKELLDLGFKELSSNPKNIIIIEWADKIKKIIPKNALWIKFKFINKTTRAIDIL